MTEKLQAIRGMSDVLPNQSYQWLYLENLFANCLASYGYMHIRTPLIESTDLFKRSIGEVTDIVEKEMYTFTDLNEESVSLRPEGTAGCLRACLEHGLLHNQQQKLWYLGPMFRRERPQKGRYRQFYQLGVEVFGIDGVAVELELILLCKKFWSLLGLDSELELQINTLGDTEDRLNYREILVKYFTDNFAQLDEDSKNRLTKNPLRILDTKNPDMQDLIKNAPKLIDCIKEDSKAKFHGFCEGLDALGLKYIINPCLVRGLDYYGHLVFEWVTDKLGSQATVCAGGRYDKLVEQLGGKEIKAIGFAMGIERLLLLSKIAEPATADIYVISDSNNSILLAMQVADKIRADFNLKVIVNLGLEKFKSQFKKADKSGAKLALILGEEELSKNLISLKFLRKDQEQQTIKQSELYAKLTAILKGEEL